MVREEQTNGARRLVETEIEVATTLEDLQKIQADWHDLWDRCENVTPFQSPEWLIPWWQHLGQGSLWVLSLRIDGLLRGLAPLCIRESGSPPEREILLLGTGITDYLDVLLEPGFETAGTAAFLDFIEAHSKLWDVMDFQQLRPGSPLLEWEIQPDWRSELMVQEVCPVLTLPGSVPELRFGATGRMAEKLSYYRRRAAQVGSLRAERATKDNYEEFFESFLRLHKARWEARGLPGALGENAVRCFHQDSTVQFLNTGVLRLFVLKLDHRIISVLYGFNHRGRTFHYLAGFDPHYAALSPGTLVLGHAIEEAIRQGDKEFDFLRGRETYKYLWGAKGRLNCRRRLRRNATLVAPTPHPAEQALQA